MGQLFWRVQDIKKSVYFSKNILLVSKLKRVVPFFAQTWIPSYQDWPSSQNGAEILKIKLNNITISLADVTLMDACIKFGIGFGEEVNTKLTDRWTEQTDRWQLIRKDKWKIPLKWAKIYTYGCFLNGYSPEQVRQMNTDS